MYEAYNCLTCKILYFWRCLDNDNIWAHKTAYTGCILSRLIWFRRNFKPDKICKLAAVEYDDNRRPIIKTLL